MQTHYQELNITPQASQYEIKHAFRKLALKYHPDKNRASDAADKFKKIALAYKILSDPARRMEYDLSLRSTPNIPYPPPFNADVTARPYPYELIKKYLPYFKWACWAGIVLIFLLAMDYLLPPNRLKERIVIVESVYRGVGVELKVYDHTVLITETGKEFDIFSQDISSFVGQKFIFIYITPLLSNTIAITPEKEDKKIVTSLVYGNLFFIPLLLLITSVLGILNSNRVERVFNLSVVSAILFFIVLYLMVF